VIREHFEHWNEYSDARVTSSFQFYHTCDEWLDMITDENLVFTAMIGMAVSVVIAFISLFATTQNIVLSAFATFTICGIVACLLATLVVLGWGLGLMESLNLAVVVGLSVDYSVHLANHYRTEGEEHPSATRYEKTREALWGIGGSIFAGAITTLGASSFLFFAFITFSVSFGSVIFFNIFISFLFTYGL
jgi:protein dispatched 1